MWQVRWQKLCVRRNVMEIRRWQRVSESERERKRESALISFLKKKKFKRFPVFFSSSTGVFPALPPAKVYLHTRKRDQAASGGTLKKVESGGEEKEKKKQSRAEQSREKLTALELEFVHGVCVCSGGEERLSAVRLVRQSGIYIGPIAVTMGDRLSYLSVDRILTARP